MAIVKPQVIENESNPCHFLGESRGNVRAGNGVVAGSGACVVYVGGNANNGGKAGAGYVNVNNGLTNANANIGARLTKDLLQIPSFCTGFDRWMGLAHIGFSTALERAGQTSAFPVAA